MTWFTENPWPFLLVGLLVEVVLVVILISTGRGALLSAIAGVAVLNIVLLVTERIVVTDREQVAATLDELAGALTTGDAPTVLAFIAPSATELRARAEHGLQQVKINEARVLPGLQVTLSERADPPSATAAFNARFSFKLLRGAAAPYEIGLRHFFVNLEKRDGRWLLTAVEDSHIHAP
ncbi:MAG TPA: hypothetical protein VG433_00510 [Pirellulales bacterium]|nr:hypothetical protein [Pirellulales bacterium]